MYRIIGSLYCTYETNIMLYVNYPGIKINNIIEKKRKEATKIMKKKGIIHVVIFEGRWAGGGKEKDNRKIKPTSR